MKNDSGQKKVKQTPKRSFFQFCCPCFSFNSNKHTEQPRPKMKQTEQSHSQLPSNITKEAVAIQHGQSSQDYIQRTQAEIFNLNNTGVYIDFQSSSDQKVEKTQYEIMQEEYEKYLNQNKKKVVHNYPINSLRQNILILLGNKQGKLLCKIKSVYLQPSQSSKKKQRQGYKFNDQVNDPIIDKYWQKRYTLFQKFDEGIQLDKQSWFSVTPQIVAEHIASKSEECGLVLDAFCGAGGDSIQFGLHCKRVISNDIDANKIKLLINNAAIYGVDNIETLNQDYFNLTFKRGQIQMLYLAPPWGGPDYYKLQKMQPYDFIPRLDLLFEKALTLSDNIMVLLPINTNVQSLSYLIINALTKQKIITNTCSFLIEKIYFQDQLKFLLLCFGNKVSKIGLNEQLEYIYKLLSDGKGKFKHKRVIKKLRQEFGMMFILEKLVECQKIDNQKQNFYQKLKKILTQNNIMSSQRLSRLQQQCFIQKQEQKAHQTKKSQKQRKIMIKSMKIQQGSQEKDKNIRLTYDKIEVRGNSEGSPKKTEKIQQTVSYVSSFSDSKIIESRANVENYSFNSTDKEGVRIESIIESPIMKEQGRRNE